MELHQIYSNFSRLLGNPLNNATKHTRLSMMCLHFPVSMGSCYHKNCISLHNFDSIIINNGRFIGQNKRETNSGSC